MIECVRGLVMNWVAGRGYSMVKKVPEMQR